MNKKKFFVALLVTILVFFSVAGGVSLANFLYGSNLSGDVTKLLDVAPTDKVNILCMGLDEDKTRSDTIMLVSLDPKANTIKLLSIPRDTRVLIRNGHYDKINSCMGYKSREELIINVIKNITGMPVHYYCEIDFSGFIEVIDILGGVDYNIPYDMNYDDPVQNLHIHFKAGQQHLDGQAAHDFVRFRHNNSSEPVFAPGEYAMGDEGRIQAQQNFLKELLRQKLNPQYLTKMPELIDQMYKHVTTNFTVADAIKYSGMLKNFGTDSFQTFTLPGEAKYMNNLWYYVYDPEETKQLILTEFGYPEEEAAKLPSASPSASSVATAGAGNR